MDKMHEVQVSSFNGPVMHLRVDGKNYDIDLTRESRRLANASQEQREKVEISPSGYGLHWPDVDEDLSIDGLIGIKHNYPIARAQE